MPRCAIEHYRATHLSQALQLLERDASPVENVREVVRFFETLELLRQGVERALHEARARGELAPANVVVSPQP